MNRVKWLDAKWPFNMRKLGSRLKEMSFSDETPDGFVIERIRDDFIEGRFIEKCNLREVVIDPFGREGVQERIAYHTTNFTLFSQYPFIEVRNSQRSIKEFLGRLLEACNFALVVRPITVELLDWVDNFQKLVDHHILVDSIQVSGVKLDEGISGKILLKGEKDVRFAIIDILKDKKYSIDKLQLRINLHGRNVVIHLGSNGSIKIHSDLTIEFSSLLRASLPQAN